jgi:hypothetical protein
MLAGGNVPGPFNRPLCGTSRTAIRDVSAASGHWPGSGKSRRNIELVLPATLGAFLMLQTVQMA